MDSAAGWLFPEILEMIFSNLELRDLVACSGVNRAWNVAANTAKLWKKFLSKSDLSWLPTNVNCELHSSSITTDNNPSQSFPASNPYRNIIQQRNQVKHNWINGCFTSYDLDPSEYGWKLTSYNTTAMEYPSNAPQDCAYYPVVGKFSNTKFVNLFRFDTVLELVCRLPIDFEVNDVLVCCVMRDFIAWLLKDGTVPYVTLPTCDKCSFEQCQVKTLNFFTVTKPKGSECLLTMDANHIVISTFQFLKVWNKKSVELILSRCSPTNFDESRPSVYYDEYPLYLDDGYIIKCYRTHIPDTTLIEEYNLETNSKLPTEFTMRGTVTGVKCTGNCVVMKYYEMEFYSFIQVRRKNDLKLIIFTYNCYDDSNYTTYEIVGNSFLIYRLSLEDYEEIEISTGVRSPIRKLPVNCLKVSNLFDSLALIRTECMEIWDWKRNCMGPKLHDSNRLIIRATPKWIITNNDTPSGLHFKVYRCN
ncbi:uncharacterized protein LOC111058138 [Nilaparvata lugens]|uniref:uncharacterized protein LOC111058138 n=1 Tax=Nilaparvata lugens TaxID=108931 RepID=UPI00193DE413|nr:uncharacterized protein LOC111058138 [Nilaparvata lugens]